jgi:hypothetical protein
VATPSRSCIGGGANSRLAPVPEKGSNCGNASDD